MNKINLLLINNTYTYYVNKKINLFVLYYC